MGALGQLYDRLCKPGTQPSTNGPRLSRSPTKAKPLHLLGTEKYNSRAKAPVRMAVFKDLLGKKKFGLHPETVRATEDY